MRIRFASLLRSIRVLFAPVPPKRLRVAGWFAGQVFFSFSPMQAMPATQNNQPLITPARSAIRQPPDCRRADFTDKEPNIKKLKGSSLPSNIRAYP